MQSPFARKEETTFNWDILGDVEVGRNNLGLEMPVVVYRLFEYTMRAALTSRYGKDEATESFRDAGYLAGSEFAKHLLDLTLDFDAFIAQLQKTMMEMKIGIFRVESFDPETGKAVVTVSEDLDCSGLPIIGEAVCTYDEGFISGVLSTYTKKPYSAIEIDCWAKGDRVCRFEAKVKQD